jgi:predicted HD phosphohydrolase
MTQQHPITPPPTELVQQWVDTYFGGKISQSNFHVDLATRAAQWGADQELEACCEWVKSKQTYWAHDELRAARRPKPPSLNQLAMQMLSTIERDAHYLPEITDTIRRALEQLDD